MKKVAFLFVVGIIFALLSGGYVKAGDPDNIPASGKNIINIDKIENIRNFSIKYSSDNYKIINLIEDSIRDVDLNINPELLLYNLFIKIKSQIKNVQ